VTLADQVARTERLARVSSNEVTLTAASDVTRIYINEGVREFCKYVNGIPAEDYLTLSPRFDTRTNFALRFTITGGTNALVATNVALTTVNRTDATGTQVATDLQATLRAAIGGGANITVTFNLTGTNYWRFTFDTINATRIQVQATTELTQVDATGIILGGNSLDSGVGTNVTATGFFPTDMNVETDLPSTFLEIEYVEWDTYRLAPAPYNIFISPEYSGDPIYYAVKNNRIRVLPSPTDQKLFHIRFKQAFADLDTTGAADATASPLPSNEHMAPVYYASSKLLEEKHEYDKSRRMLEQFYELARRYKIRESNQSPSMYPAWPVILPLDVDVPQSS
jgi:hypothetical protein